MESSVKDVIKVVGLCVVWYASSSANGVIGKTLLTDFPYPMTLTMFQIMTVVLCSKPMFLFSGIRYHKTDMPWNFFWKFIVPLAFGKFFSSVFSHISIWKVPVSYAHTVKATMPLFTVVLSRLILHEVQTLKVYISLLPIIAGVLIASITEVSFDFVGLVCALAATAGFSVQHVVSKKVLTESKMHHLNLLYTLAKMAFILFIPVWLTFDFRKIVKDEHFIQNTDKFRIFFLLTVDGLLNFIQNVVAFSVLSLVTPLTYSVCSSTKRISIITVSLVMLKNPVTSFNFFGMALAIFGVMLYNKAKYDTMKEEKKVRVLPYVKGDANILLREQNGYSPFLHFLGSETGKMNGHTARDI